jgi:hypothetical protein
LEVGPFSDEVDLEKNIRNEYVDNLLKNCCNYICLKDSKEGTEADYNTLEKFFSSLGFKKEDLGSGVVKYYIESGHNLDILCKKDEKDITFIIDNISNINSELRRFKDFEPKLKDRIFEVAKAFAKNNEFPYEDYPLKSKGGQWVELFRNASGRLETRNRPHYGCKLKICKSKKDSVNIGKRAGNFCGPSFFTHCSHSYRTRPMTLKERHECRKNMEKGYREFRKGMGKIARIEAITNSP